MQQVIFDFDGTLVDSLPVAVRLAKKMVPDLPLSEKDIARLRGLPAREIIKQSGIPPWKILKLLLQGKRLLGQHLDELKTFKGIAQALQQVHEAGCRIVVVSSNSEANIRKVLRREGVEQYTSQVYGNVGLFGKARVFRKIMQTQKVSTKKMVYVGDEVRDIEAAHRAGIPVVAVTWGYNSEPLLKKYNPEALAHTTDELVKHIKTIVSA